MQPAKVHYLKREGVNSTGGIRQEMLQQKDFTKGLKNKGYMYCVSYVFFLLDDLKDRRGYSHLKEEALDSTMWRKRFGGGFEPVVRQNTE
jgi:hypothetical protein